MEQLNWFVSILKVNFNVNAHLKEVSYESTELHLDEIDESLVPQELIKNMPETLIFETMVFYDNEGTEWLGAVALHPDTKESCLQVVLKDGEPVLRKLVEKENDK
ncbi:hypothetical protein ABE29_23045 [Cytobacillus firmus]|uniref:hypothetical protein n=1 Tax=Cytobacillus firmus TaxID=1399 RepID=UPI00077CB998|nr:hypothetical protein [Cytobacillus firmus]MBG9545520.1 hypothetical protein [Cytobacillus firmus]MBG9550258.1 hypothetical protein [Cytobacillus firmus]MBG9551166.1 hypothetical protein [Cytobacillus firmus]MBG9557947.1 hypothetical protein [Cytobacillus firmus]MBG9577572.1 hypothetical protein [Cytobacillus firmus]